MVLAHHRATSLDIQSLTALLYIENGDASEKRALLLQTATHLTNFGQIVNAKLHISKP